MIGAGVHNTGRYNLIAMWVEPKSRELGVAGCLVDAVKSNSIKRGVNEVFLAVSSNNSRAVQLYKKHGFVFIGEERPLDNHPDILIQTMKWQSIL